MKIDEEFMKELANKIDALVTVDVFNNAHNLDKLVELTTLYKNMKNIALVEAQVKFAKQSEEFFKNIDFSNVDVNSLIKQMYKE